MKSSVPSFEEIRVLAHVEQLYEQYRHRLAQPLHVKVTDATGKITEYEYWPESDEELNTFCTSASPESRSFRLPVMLRFTDAKGTRVEAGPTNLSAPDG
jgi:hypothetical protein